MESTHDQKRYEETVQAKLNTEDVELNEDQLEAVAGGAKGIIGSGSGDCTTGPIIFDPLTPPMTTSPIDPADFY